MEEEAATKPSRVALYLKTWYEKFHAIDQMDSRASCALKRGGVVLICGARRVHCLHSELVVV